MPSKDLRVSKAAEQIIALPTDTKIIIVTGNVVKLPPRARNPRVVVLQAEAKQLAKDHGLGIVIFEASVPQSLQDKIRSHAAHAAEGAFSPDQIRRILRKIFVGEPDNAPKTKASAVRRRKSKTTDTDNDTVRTLTAALAKAFAEAKAKSLSGKAIASVLKRMLETGNRNILKRWSNELVRRHILRPLKEGTTRKGWYSLNVVPVAKMLKLGSGVVTAPVTEQRPELSSTPIIKKRTTVSRLATKASVMIVSSNGFDLLKPARERLAAIEKHIKTIENEHATLEDARMKLSTWLADVEAGLKKIGPPPVAL